MAVPQNKKSKSKVSMRKRSHKVSVPAAKSCPNCGDSHLPHRVCTACGYYRERQVLTIAAD